MNFQLRMMLGFMLSVTRLKARQFYLITSLLQCRQSRWILNRCHVKSTVLLYLIYLEDGWLNDFAFFLALNFWFLLISWVSYQTISQTSIFGFLTCHLISVIIQRLNKPIVLVNWLIKLKRFSVRELFITKEIVIVRVSPTVGVFV